jgi:hypothetical protein
MKYAFLIKALLYSIKHKLICTWNARCESESVRVVTVICRNAIILNAG